VVNIQRGGNPSDARLHHATCNTVSRDQSTPRPIDRRLRQAVLRWYDPSRRLGGRAHRVAAHALRVMLASAISRSRLTAGNLRGVEITPRHRWPGSVSGAGSLTVVVVIGSVLIGGC